MRCPQCGFDAVAGAAFCSRCGTRLMMPRPETRHEYALVRILPSWSHFFSQLVVAFVFGAVGIVQFYTPHGSWRVTAGLIAVALVIVGLTAIARRSLSWSVTSERLIERRGLLASRRRELELADIRSVEVEQRLIQRLLGVGTVIIASAASADFLIRLDSVPDPDHVADTVRKARLRRLA